MISKALATLSLLAGASVVALAQPAQVQTRTVVRPAADGALQPDPAARIGRLDNGMGYIVYRNATPPGQVSVRLHFRAGDLMERDEQNGLAHFIEHMVLNETRNIPEGELIRMLERQGMAFGRETNAFTAPDQTVYVLDVPAVNEEKIDTVFRVLRELAGEAIFSPEAIDRERGIIQSEDRSMYPPARRGFVARDRFIARGQLISERLDIGSLEVIRTAPREQFVDFYRSYYRPERATLIVVGDVDPAAVEAKIRNVFSNWRGQGEAGPEPQLGRPAQRGFEADSFVQEGALREVSLTWVRPYEHEPDSLAERRELWRERLALAVLTRRLQRLAESGDAPFTGPGAFAADYYRSMEQTRVRVEPKPGRYAESTALIEREARRLAEHGILEQELQREIVETRSRLQAAAAGAATRQTAAIANELMQAVNAEDVPLSPQQALAVFEHSVQGYDAAAASAVARDLFTGSGPLLFAISPEPIDGGHERLALAFRESARSAVEPPVAQAARAWPYERFGAPGRVARREEIADLGVTRVTFANGVTLLVKPTDFADDQVMVSARIGGGRLALRPGLPTFLLDQGAFIEGGLEELTHEEIRQALAGRVWSAGFGVLDNGFILQGTTRPQDLPLQLQLLTAYAAHPGWRPEAFERKRTELQNLLNLVATTPLNLALTRLPRLVRSGDSRWGLPTREELANAALPPVRAAIDPALGSAPIEVVMVGDVTVDEAIAQVAATFGALPQRAAEAPALPGADRIAFASTGDQVHRLTHSGRPDVAMGLVAWPTDDFFDDPAEARAMQVLRSVLQIRTIDKLREELGATYSPVVLQESSETFDEFGMIAMGAEVNPAQLDPLMQVIGEVAAELKAGEVGADELSRAVEPMLQALSRERAGNQFWLGRLGGASWDPRRLESIRQQEALLRAVTAAEIRRLAQKYLRDERAFRLIVAPAGAAPAAPVAPQAPAGERG